MTFLASPTPVTTDTWVAATWEEFIALADHPDWQLGRFYYDAPLMRIEMAALGPWHGRDNTLISNLVSLFAALKGIPIVGLTNTSFRKTGIREAQPDLAFYLGENLSLPPRTNAPIDLDRHDPPALAVEIASTSLSDDLGRKRLLYERLGVQEYWVIDVAASQVIAFAVANGGSSEIRASQVLPGLAFSLVEAALQRSQTEDDGAIQRWLIAQFS